MRLKNASRDVQHHLEIEEEWEKCVQVALFHPKTPYSEFSHGKEQVFIFIWGKCWHFRLSFSDLQKLPFHSERYTTLISTTELSWFREVSGRATIREHRSWARPLPTLMASFWKEWPLHLWSWSEGKNPVNNLQSAELFLFCILNPPGTCDCLCISTFQVAKWWNMIG